MSVIECKNCQGRFRITTTSPGQKVSCPRCGVALRTDSRARATTRGSTRENVTADGGLRMSGMVTRPSRGKKPVMIVAGGLMLVTAVTVFLAMRG